MNLVQKTAFKILVMLLMGAFLGGCQQDDGYSKGQYPSDRNDFTSKKDPGKTDAESGGCRTIEGAETVSIAGVSVSVKSPQSSYMGDILILHGWDEGRETWCKRSRLCLKANKKGFRVIMPDMGKSVYVKKNYPETREDWRQFPSYAWLRDSLIAGLQDRFCLLSEKGQNFVIGVSAGARGAMRLIQEEPELFVAAAALSGL